VDGAVALVTQRRDELGVIVAGVGLIAFGLIAISRVERSEE
jgi:hypothetical protein